MVILKYRCLYFQLQAGKTTLPDQYMAVILLDMVSLILSKHSVPFNDVQTGSNSILEGIWW